MLVHFLSERPIIIKTDTINYALGVVMSQECENGCLHPAAFHSKKFKPVEINYDIQDKEMLAIVAALKEWKHMLKLCQEEFIAFIDHKTLSTLLHQRYYSDVKLDGQSSILHLGLRLNTHQAT